MNPLAEGRRQAVNIIRAGGGLSAFGRRNCSEKALSNWNIFSMISYFKIILDCTNDKAHSMNIEFSTTLDEISSYIGVTILIGVYKGRGEPVPAVWSEAEGRKCISQFMKRTRYELITKYLRFDLTSSRTVRRHHSKFAPKGNV